MAPAATGEALPPPRTPPIYLLPSLLVIQPSVPLQERLRESKNEEGKECRENTQVWLYPTVLKEVVCTQHLLN